VRSAVSAVARFALVTVKPFACSSLMKYALLVVSKSSVPECAIESVVVSGFPGGVGLTLAAATAGGALVAVPPVPADEHAATMTMTAAATTSLFIANPPSPPVE